MYGKALMAKAINNIFDSGKKNIKLLANMAMANANAYGCENERELFQDDKQWRYS